MSQLVQLGKVGAARRQAVAGPRPAWLRVRATSSRTFDDVSDLLHGLNLNTVCEDARCPNIWECWGEHKTATLMILGDTCTRACRYCSVHSGKPTRPPDADEPARVAEAVARLGLRHAVITSVDRDDLPDYGAGHFVATIAAIRRRTPSVRIELLIPDFMGDGEALDAVLRAGPDVVGHNIETVPRLYRRLRSKGVYPRSLQVLARVHAFRGAHGRALTTKTGIILGMGETFAEVCGVMDDLRGVHCDVLTLGQYLSPTAKHLPVQQWIAPETFAALRQEALGRHFLHCESGPLVRSSYHAHAHVPAA